MAIGRSHCSSIHRDGSAMSRLAMNVCLRKFLLLHQILAKRRDGKKNSDARASTGEKNRSVCLTISGRTNATSKNRPNQRALQLTAQALATRRCLDEDVQCPFASASPW